MILSLNENSKTKNFSTSGRRKKNEGGHKPHFGDVSCMRVSIRSIQVQQKPAPTYCNIPNGISIFVGFQHRYLHNDVKVGDGFS